MRRVAEESTFFVGDAIRINIGGEGLVILICRIWATKTQDLPKVFVDGEVLIKMP